MKYLLYVTGSDLSTIVDSERTSVGSIEAQTYLHTQLAQLLVGQEVRIRATGDSDPIPEGWPAAYELPAGPQGEPGPAGADGVDGTGIYTGVTLPSAAAYNLGDLFIRTADYGLYRLESTGWVLVGNVKGADGAAGSSGMTYNHLWGMTGTVQVGYDTVNLCNAGSGATLKMPAKDSSKLGRSVWIINLSGGTALTFLGADGSAQAAAVGANSCYKYTLVATNSGGTTLQWYRETFTVTLQSLGAS